ncbi:hypothetical protein [Flavobacterium sp. ov086]|uniref:hypothetical protein n=1 Tax=Flavobacterium sp. ov086 TaxID=1761785 RepID=UPI000B644DA3|nr:hypothetical protein [Flavobacterium sp. ov086]SNR31484.1 hypothetical protein SAMN04487979_102277 [Flavobacterium sp. ov086]
MKKIYAFLCAILICTSAARAQSPMVGTYYLKGDVASQDLYLLMLPDGTYAYVEHYGISKGSWQNSNNNTIEMIRDSSENEAFYLYGRKSNFLTEKSDWVKGMEPGMARFYFNFMFSPVAISFDKENALTMRPVFNDEKNVGFTSSTVDLPINSLKQINLIFYRISRPSIESDSLLEQSTVYSFALNKDYNDYSVYAVASDGREKQTATITNGYLQVGDLVFERIDSVSETEIKNLKTVYDKQKSIKPGMFADKIIIKRYKHQGYADYEFDLKYDKVPIIQKTVTPIKVDKMKPYIEGKKGKDN